MCTTRVVSSTYLLADHTEMAEPVAYSCQFMAVKVTVARTKVAVELHMDSTDMAATMELIMVPAVTVHTFSVQLKDQKLEVRNRITQIT